ncbi:MAG: hypothetical protein AAF658_11590, partial [Myxococcota bacterium]
MMNEIVDRLKSLSDTQLLEALQSATQTERRSTAALVAYIAEVDARRLYLELVRLFPREDAPSRLRKLPAVRAEDREAREHPTGCGLFGDTSASVVQPIAPARSSEGSRSEPSPESVPAFERHRPSDVSRCTALSESRYRLQVTLPEHTRAKLDAARELLRHQVPDGDLASVLDHALDALIEARMKRKFAKTTRPRRERAPAQRHSPASSAAESPIASYSSRSDDSKPPSAQSSPHPRSRSRHIPNAIKRAVVQRDGMRCSFVDEEGCRCTDTSPLEFHHHDPFAKGGAHSVENV